MVALQGELINLRSLKFEDLAFLYSLENNKSLWELSQTQKTFSKEVLRNYLDTAQRDIQETTQLRFCNFHSFLTLVSLHHQIHFLKTKIELF